MRTKFFHRKQNLITQSQNMECQSFKKFGTRVGQWEIFKTWIFSHFVSSNAISLHDFKLIYACSDVCVNYSTKFAIQFPKVLLIIYII